MKQAIDFSQPFEDLFGGGGSFFDSGRYRVTRSVFGYYDFNKPGNDALCLIQTLQPVDEKGKDAGDEVTRYFPVGGKSREGVIYIEPCDPVKGEKKAFKSIRFTDNDKHGKIGKTTEFGVFMEYAHKNGVDMDAIQNDITAFTDNVYEYGTVEIKKTSKQKSAVEEAEDGGDGKKKAEFDTKTYVVITSQPAKAKSKAKDADEKPKGKGKPAADDDEEEKPTKSSKKPKGPAGLVTEYLEGVKKEIAKSGSADRMSHKLALSKWLKNEKEMDADDVKGVMKVYNDDDELDAVLTSMGLERNDDDEFVEED